MATKAVNTVNADQLANKVDQFISQQDDRDDTAYTVLTEFQEFVFPELKRVRIRKEAILKLTVAELESLGLGPTGLKLEAVEHDDTDI